MICVEQANKKATKTWLRVRARQKMFKSAGIAREAKSREICLSDTDKGTAILGQKKLRRAETSMLW